MLCLFVISHRANLYLLPELKRTRLEMNRASHSEASVLYEKYLELCQLCFVRGRYSMGYLSPLVFIIIVWPDGQLCKYLFCQFVASSFDSRALSSNDELDTNSFSYLKSVTHSEANSFFLLALNFPFPPIFSKFTDIYIGSC